jgi:hypothetical protein
LENQAAFNDFLTLSKRVSDTDFMPLGLFCLRAHHSFSDGGLVRHSFPKRRRAALIYRFVALSATIETLSVSPTFQKRKRRPTLF